MGFIERLFSSDKTLCEACLYELMQGVREKGDAMFNEDEHCCDEHEHEHEHVLDAGLSPDESDNS